MRFFVGIHQPCDARYVHNAFISIHRIAKRASGFEVKDWILDSGAFSTLQKHGEFRDSPEYYAKQIKRWSLNGNMLAAVTQDYMCEPHMLERTGMNISQHQIGTINRYDKILQCDLNGAYLMPVLQGYAVEDYLVHLDMYGERLPQGAWVGVGSICKRNGNPAIVESILRAIKGERPDLNLHGFGLKLTALSEKSIRGLLHSSDSMAWSYAARMTGGDRNSVTEAIKFANRVNAMCRED